MSRFGMFLTALLTPLVLALGIYVALDEDKFTPLRMLGAPVVQPGGNHPALLFLTVHHETRARFAALRDWEERGRSHVDLWAFSARDFSPMWVRRVVSRPDAAGAAEAGVALIGASGTQALVRVPAGDVGYALADGAAREGVTAAGGAVVAPMAVGGADAGLRVRGAVLGGAWYGMAHGDDIAGFAQGRTTAQDYALAREYRLWTARVTETRNFVFNTTDQHLDRFEAVLSTLRFLRGGLLARGFGDGREALTLAEPARLLVLHERDTAGEAWRFLTCLRLSGAVCWEAELGMTQVRGLVSIYEATPDLHALILLGDRKRPGEGGDLPERTMLRIGTREREMRAINLGAMDLHALKLDVQRRVVAR